MTPTMVAPRSPRRRSAVRSVDGLSGAVARALLAAAALLATPATAPLGARSDHETPAPSTALLIVPDRLLDGTGSPPHRGWALLTVGERIAAVGPRAGLDVPAGARVIELPGTTLLPGLIEGHAHVLLHPYDETPWNDQVLRESDALRVARATVHLRATLAAGVTTVRDLGTEGAGYADVGLRQAVAEGIIPGPRLLVAGPAIVATGSYGPKGFAPHVRVPLGAEEADGPDLVRVVRDQIGKGADWIKVYADYRWGAAGEARPTFSTDELRAIVDTAGASGRRVAAHAATAEGIRRALEAGVATIEHGDDATPELLARMASQGVWLCPTLAAVDAIERYRGWNGEDPEPLRIRAKRASFAAALAAGTPLCMGGDVGVYAHGSNVRELELMVAYGMTPAAAIVAATSGNARMLGLGEEIGSLRPGRRADLLAVAGDPSTDIASLRAVELVVQGGRVVRSPTAPGGPGVDTPTPPATP